MIGEDDQTRRCRRRTWSRCLGDPHLHRGPDRRLAARIGDQATWRSALLDPVDLEGIYDLHAAERGAGRVRSDGDCDTMTIDVRALPSMSPRAPAAAGAEIAIRSRGVHEGVRTEGSAVLALSDLSARRRPEGRVRLSGRRLRLRQEHAAQHRSRASTRLTLGTHRDGRHGSALMFQEPALFPWLTVAAERRAGAEAVRRARRATRQRARGAAAPSSTSRASRRQAAARAVGRHAPAGRAWRAPSPRTPRSC